MYKYTWCIYNLRTLTPTCLRRTKIGLIFLFTIQFQNLCNISKEVRPNGPITGWVLSPRGPFQLICDPSFRCDHTEKPLWTRKRCLTSWRTFVFTRSEKFVLNNDNKQKGLFLLLQRETYYSTFAWHAATQTQTSNVFKVKCLQSYFAHYSNDG